MLYLDSDTLVLDSLEDLIIFNNCDRHPKPAPFSNPEEGSPPPKKACSQARLWADK